MSGHVLLQSTVLGSNTSQVDFNSIPQTGYTSLQLIVNPQSSSGSLPLLLRVNSNSSSIYNSVTLEGTNSQQTTQSYFYITWVNTNNFGETGARPALFVYDFMMYNQGFSRKQIAARNYWADSGPNAAICRINDTSELAITSISLFAGTSGNFASGSTFYLYGIV